MKKYLLSFIFSVVGLVATSADEYTGVMVANGEQIVRYLFTAKPTVKYETVEGVVNASFYIEGQQAPVVSVPLENGKKMRVSYDSWIILKLNTAGFATFSAADDSYIATDGVKAYKANVSGSDIILNELEGYIPSGNGVLLYGGSSMAGTTVDLPKATAGDAASMDDNSLLATTLADGSLAAKPANAWSLGPANQFLPYAPADFIHNRAYLVFTAPTAAKAMRMIFANDEETTGIDAAIAQSAVRSGKFLENGKIVIVKNGKKYNIGGQVIK